MTLKDPDGVYNAITDAAAASLAANADLSDNERDLLQESRHAEIEEALSKWIEHNEYIVLEFDTDTETASVKPARA